MPISQPVNKEAVRMLVADIGYQEASQRTGIAYATLRQWSKRGKWKVAAPHSQAVTAVTRSPVDAHADVIAELESQTRMSLARSVKRLAKDSEHATLRHSGEVKNVAQTAAIVHRWDTKQTQANVMVNIALLGVDPCEVQAKVTDVSDTASLGYDGA
jgi:hypothetical protein